MDVENRAILGWPCELFAKHALQLCVGRMDRAMLEGGLDVDL